MGKQCSREGKLLYDGLMNTPEGTGTFADSILEVHEGPVQDLEGGFRILHNDVANDFHSFAFMIC